MTGPLGLHSRPERDVIGDTYNIQDLIAEIPVGTNTFQFRKASTKPVDRDLFLSRSSQIIRYP